MIRSTGAVCALLIAAAIGSVARAQPATVSAPVANSVEPQLVHVFATPDGETHLEVLSVAATAGVLPLTGLRAISYKPNKVDWHHAPTPQFAINLTGDLQVETSDGSKRHIGPGDLVYLEDTQGKGHITRLLGPVTALFIQPTPNFDIRAWAKGAAKPGG